MSIEKNNKVELSEKYSYFNKLDHIYFSLPDYIFILFFMYNFVIMKSNVFYTRKMLKWTGSFTLKFLLSILTSILYSTFPILFMHKFGCLSFLYWINSLSWVFSSINLYLEFRRKLPQSWIGLRMFWILEGITTIVRLSIFIVTLIDEINDNDRSCIAFLTMIIIISVPKLILFFLAFFKNKDHIYSTNLQKQFLETFSNTNNEDKHEKNSNEIIGIKKASIYFEDLKNKDTFNKFFIEIELSEVKARKFSYRTNQVMSQGLKSTIISSKERDIFIIFQIKVELILKDKKNSSDYNKKLSLSEVSSIYDNHNLYIEELSKINEILKEWEEQNKMLTSTFTSPKGSFTMKNINHSELSLPKLGNLYSTLSKKYSYFLEEFFNVLEIENTHNFTKHLNLSVFSDDEDSMHIKSVDKSKRFSFGFSEVLSSDKGNNFLFATYFSNSIINLASSKQ